MLHPVDDSAEIATLEKRLREVDEDIQRNSSAMLNEILAQNGTTVELRLSASLGQGPKALGAGTAPNNEEERGNSAGTA